MTKNAYTIWLGKTEGLKRMGDLDVDGGKIF
jgi:hypothetical protein